MASPWAEFATSEAGKTIFSTVLGFAAGIAGFRVQKWWEKRDQHEEEVAAEPLQQRSVTVEENQDLRGWIKDLYALMKAQEVAHAEEMGAMKAALADCKSDHVKTAADLAKTNERQAVLQALHAKTTDDLETLSMKYTALQAQLANQRLGDEASQ
jgi:hypothetical protein